MNPPAPSPDFWIGPALEALDAALRGETPPVEFLPSDDDGVPRWVSRPDATLAEGPRPAVVVRTSGSTGTAKQTLLSAEALRASAEATAETLSGHGQWLLPLQPSYVAGLAVLSRSLVAGTVPVPLLAGTTDPATVAQAAEQMTAQRRFVSLVPTQLSRLLETGDARTVEALRRFDTILLGGGASPAPLLRRAEDVGLTVVRTYGMSETCGGCVYDGRPLPGVGVDTDETGRVRLSGQMVALGYLDDEELTAAHFDVAPVTGHRRFRTDDLGALTTGEDHSAGQPRLSISGRADDVINTGGVKVSAEQVRATLLEQHAVRDAFVGAAPDPDWGQRVCAAVVLTTGSRSEDTVDRLREAVREAQGPAAVPKQLHVLRALPLLASGKPDRRELLRMFAG
ncbi:AMP-binding protein [Nesterenkonia xinjiangensis]|uniref:O-succinylbenzoic acid--CoA ligase n=1 Tax=Nesterenkonia xinjiangensis TaxID=225327 RepID=A0A7Z0K8D2_9MICC|nr:AMP-binding protein [Nesterenkonia xinjiangensis]NYJ77526.1 O-succinylbenzoic acid--CoA ligase [Nesterenkonia xinjiangensis]